MSDTPKNEQSSQDAESSRIGSSALLAAVWIARLECPHCGDEFKYDGEGDRYCGECTEKIAIPPSDEDFAAIAAKKLFQSEFVSEKETAQIIRDAAFRFFR